MSLYAHSRILLAVLPYSRSLTVKLTDSHSCYLHDRKTFLFYDFTVTSQIAVHAAPGVELTQTELAETKGVQGSRFRAWICFSDTDVVLFHA